MNRVFVRVLAVSFGLVVFGGLVHAVLFGAGVSEPAAETVYVQTPRRVWATLTAALSLLGVVTGGLAVARTRRTPHVGFGRSGGIVALVAGIAACLGGGLILAAATGGPGSGNGVVGAAAAVVLGAVAMGMAGLALARIRRAAIVRQVSTAGAA